MLEITLTPDQWHRAQQLFHEGVVATPEERDRLLADLEEHDQVVLAEVQSLLSAHARGGLVGDAPDDLAPEEIGGFDGTGPYRIVRLLGEGGMGSVYLADRQGEGFTQRVALKIMRTSVLAEAVAERLEQERAILARLEHPSIARLIDGGATPHGSPYLAMEYVEGTNLIDYCDDHRLTLPQRLALFIEICQPVHYAHQQLVVHRDLKPNNILVTPEGRVKLLDFGIAKMLDTGGGVAVHHTGQWLTPAYASPEQLRGRQLSTLSDVYALGILLYDMVSGTRPYRFDLDSPTEIERAICDEVPPPPASAVAALDPAAGAAVAAARATTQDRLRRALAGDLDAVVLKAMAKSPEDRYASVLRLAEDLRRYLDSRPVLALPQTTAYRAQRFVSRHWGRVLVAAVAAASLVGGTIATAWQARRATRQARIAATQRDLAADQAAKAALVTGLVVDLFQLSDPTETLGDTVTAREILDRGTRRIDRDFGDQPDVQAAVFDEVARVYANLGLLYRAESLTRRSLAIKETLHGRQSLEASTTLGYLGYLLDAQDDREGAETLLREAIGIRTTLLDQPDSTLAAAQARLAWVLRDLGRGDEAKTYFDLALATQERLDHHPEVADILFGLATTHHDKGAFDEAEAVFSRALATYDTATSRPNPEAATALVSVGIIKRLREQYEASLPLIQAAYEMRRALFDPGHPDLIVGASSWAAALHDVGRYAEAEAILRTALPPAVESLGWDHQYVNNLRETLASLLNHTARYEESVVRYDSALAVKLRRDPGDSPGATVTLTTSSVPLARIGRLEEARARLTEAVEMAERLHGPRAVYKIMPLQHLARLAHRRGDAAAADAFLNESVSIGEDHLSRPTHRYFLAAKRLQAEMLIDRGDHAAAIPLLEDVFRAERAKFSGVHRDIGRTLVHLGRAHAETGRRERAVQIITEALTHFGELTPDHPLVSSAEAILDRVVTR